ncbi:cob(I)yrinic acid a,c-diamide adenosyltransferase [Natronospira bacteriovora]|uniref:Corrinoid adenosyltransferase n=1 Tax=Natronospira bacteriovora TaxID=3069753 RepID=A0ABU0WA09_9GAMM|nr:cob(I)yrinic acid a,c-diamide adenosyltransferase [Natronospira sp. AB-CW4]MDQ2070588.1 cob(I)yrinic acid a,c-diamide adenosyltransferase [Natronospira sp. AB-CW4]
MGKRLSKIYTRTGDKGTTGLGDGSRVDKDDARVSAYGTTDELNAVVGMVLAEDLPEDIRHCLMRVQHDLFDLGGELCMPGWTVISADYTERLEQSLDGFNAGLPALEDFILPSGGRATAACHLARTVCRRAERVVWTLSKQEAINPEVARYLNRLSDLLFVLARVIVRHEQGEEVIWKKGYSQAGGDSNKS